MKIRYWVRPYANELGKNLPVLTEPREEDGKVLVECSLSDFIVRNAYGNNVLEDYSKRERVQIWMTVASYELLAEANMLSVDQLRAILREADKINNPGTYHPLGLSTIEEIVQDKDEYKPKAKP